MQETGWTVDSKQRKFPGIASGPGELLDKGKCWTGAREFVSQALIEDARLNPKMARQAENDIRAGGVTPRCRMALVKTSGQKVERAGLKALGGGNSDFDSEFNQPLAESRRPEDKNCPDDPSLQCVSHLLRPATADFNYTRRSSPPPCTIEFAELKLRNPL